MTKALTTTNPIVTIKDGKVFANSRDVADFFGKRHANVLRAIDALECSPRFTQLNFEFSDYLDSTGRKLRSVNMTKDGFAFLVMGFTGREAARFKEAYINRFNEMEEELRIETRCNALGTMRVIQSTLDGHEIRGVATSRGAYIVAADLVYALYPKAREKGVPGPWFKDLPSSEKVLLTRKDAPQMFEGRPNNTYTVLSESGALRLSRPNKNGAGRGGKDAALRKARVYQFLQDTFLPRLREAGPTGQLTASEMREKARALLEAADALEALAQAKTRAEQALLAVA